MKTVIFWTCALGLPLCFSFQPATQHQRANTSRHLVPLRTIQHGTTSLSRADLPCLDTEGNFRDYRLSLVEEPDLVDLSRLTVEVFGTDVVRLGSGAGSVESILMTPAIELVNGYSGMVAFAEVLAGLRSRVQDRLPPRDLDLPKLSPSLSRDEKIKKASSSSLVLAIGKGTDTWQSEIIASIELRLQPCDAKIPFSFPWIDRVERRLASMVGFENSRMDQDLQPYLSNLCVDKKFRGLGLGRALVRVVEDIACAEWGYSKLYLHVDPDNKAAFSLYASEGYKKVDRRWNPAWAGKSSDIAYLIKDLNTSTAR